MNHEALGRIFADFLAWGLVVSWLAAFAVFLVPPRSLSPEVVASMDAFILPSMVAFGALLLFNPYFAKGGRLSVVLACLSLWLMLWALGRAQPALEPPSLAGGGVLCAVALAFVYLPEPPAFVLQRRTQILVASLVCAVAAGAAMLAGEGRFSALAFVLGLLAAAQLGGLGALTGRDLRGLAMACLGTCLGFVVF